MKTLGFTLPPVVWRVLSELPDELPVALAGGAVRDLLIGRPIHDYDFLVPENAMRTARKLADRLGAAYFPLDEERDYARLVWQNGERILLDFSAYRGPDLLADLKGRDFTINAIAIDLRSPDKLIDPIGGVNDLLSKQVRACSPQAFLNDAVRVLRAVRMAGALGARLPADTLRLMREAIPELSTISPERMRDELFKILELQNAVAALRILETIGVLPVLLPELVALKGLQQSPPHINDAWEHTLDVINRLQSILDVLAPVYDEEEAGNLMLGLVAMRLGRYRIQLAEHFSQQLNPDRSLRALLNFAALYHDVGKPFTRSVEEDGRVRFFQHDQLGAKMVAVRSQALRLSNPESQRLRTIVYNHMRPSWLAHDGIPSRKAVYHYFKETGAAGVDICLLSLADTLGTYGATLPQEKWAGLLDVVRTLLENWWEHPQKTVSPPLLVNGNEIMQALSLSPGPEVGEVLNAVREAQAIGEINTHQEALAFAQDYHARHAKS